MEGAKITSFVGILLLFLSSILFIVSISTTKWFTAETSYDMKDIMKIFMGGSGIPSMPTNQPEFTMPAMPTMPPGFTLPGGMTMPKFTMPVMPTMPDMTALLQGSIGFEMGGGLKKVCFEYNFDVSDQLKAQMPNIPGSMCQEYGTNDMDGSNVTIPDGLMKKEENIKDALNKTFILMVVTILFTAVAFVLAVIKAPCIEISVKNLVLMVTIFIALLGVILGISAIATFDNEAYSETDGINGMLKAGATASANSPQEKQLAAQFIDKLKMSKGMSYKVAITAEVFLVLALILNIVEFFLTRRSGGGNAKDGYGLTA